MKKENIVKRLGMSILGTLLFGSVGTLSLCIPNLTNPSLALLICVWLLSGMIGICFFWQKTSPNLLASFIVILNINVLILLAGTLHHLHMSLVGLGVKIQLWVWIPLLVYFFVLVWVLPIINEPLAKKIHNRLLAPQTFIEKYYVPILLLLTMAMSIGLYIYDVYHPGKIQDYVLITLPIAILSYMITLSFSQTAAYQIWAKHQNQDRSKAVNSKEGSMFKRLFASPSQRFYFVGKDQVLHGDFEKAIQSFSKAIEIDPENEEAYFLRGNAYNDSGRPELALKDYAVVLKRNPEDQLALYNRSLAYLSLQQFDQAIEDLSRLIQLAPEEPNGYNLRSVVNSQKGEYSLAVADATRVIELGNEIQGLTNRSLAYERQGNLPAAIADETALLEKVPQKESVYCRRGLLYAEYGKKEKALADLKKGLKKRSQVRESLRREAEQTLTKLNVEKSGE
ncbi:MAG: tetratricopeptide repeat protein [Anaerolineaceae bacterium]|nr:tetratricopeptide repeat protein [Anaerolineaceae bacterium]